MSSVSGDPAWDAGSGKLLLEVPDMDCASCAQRIAERLEKLDGVQTVDARVVAKDVRIRFDPDLLAEGTIEDAVRSLGYTVERDGHEGRSARPRRRSVWRSRDAQRSYVSGISLTVGLLLQVSGLNAVIWSGFSWTLSVASLLYVAAALVGGLNFFPKGLLAARDLRLDMNFLMTIAIFGALGIGEFFEAGSIAFLFGIAELLERYAVDRARGSIEKLLDLAPATARVHRGDDVITVPIEDVAPGQVVQVRPGEKIPVDGWVREGESSVDQSPITGESMPVNREPSDYVYAGSMNQEGYLEVEAAKRAGDTTLAHIIHLVEGAEASRSPSERFVEKFARYYTPAVTVLAITIAVVPPAVMGAPFSIWFVRGLTLLVISCPCAMVISTPVAVVSGITSAARNGVLIKGGVHLEALAHVRAVAFDKTGTLTLGEPSVVEVSALPGSGLDDQNLLAIAAALEARSEHPYGAAIRRAAAEAGIENDDRITEFEALPGRGARAQLDGDVYQIGRPELFSKGTDACIPVLERLAALGYTPICVGEDSRVLGVIALADRERDGAREVIESLRRYGIQRIVMLTGDHVATALTMAERLGVDEVYADLLPHEKVDRVRELMTQSGSVAMVGDGVNDAPALATATVGIAMGAAASDVALETADVALMGDDLTRLPYLFRLSRRSFSVIRQNIAASIAIKLSLAAGVPLGLVSLITAVLVGDMGASLAVTTNAMRLARLRR